jgi:hypothetical protein
MIHRSSKPSRWQQPPRVTRILQFKWSLVPLDARTQCKCTRITLNLNLDQAIGKEMSGRCLHKLTRVLSHWSTKRDSHIRPMSIYNTPWAKLAIVPLQHRIRGHGPSDATVGPSAKGPMSTPMLKLVVAHQRSLWRIVRRSLSLMVTRPKVPLSSATPKSSQNAPNCIRLG